MDSSDPERKCPKCGGQMQMGFVLDQQGDGPSAAAEWAEGAPDRSWFFGVKMGGRTRFQVDAFRCDKCGFLEHCAVEPA